MTRPGERQFFEVGEFGVFALNKWAANYVELEQPRFGRVAPSPHHVYVGTRTTWPTLTRSLGWLDTSKHKMRDVKDKAIIRAILEVEQRGREKMERLVDRTRALELPNADRED